MQLYTKCFPTPIRDCDLPQTGGTYHGRLGLTMDQTHIRQLLGNDLLHIGMLFLVKVTVGV